MATTEATDTNFEKTVLEASRSKPVLVDFWAEWCGPCKQLAPIVEDIAQEKADVLTVAKLDIEENREIASQYGIMSIPTLMLFKDGKPVRQIIGYRAKGFILGQLEDHLKPAN